MVKLPRQFENMLTQSELLGPLNIFCSCATKVLQDNKMPFFPGYTDHGVTHIENVLATEARLIPAEVWESGILSEYDIAVLVAATLLHDIAMHIREDGFLQLISSTATHKPIDWFVLNADQSSSNKCWAEQWGDFMIEAKRFSDRKLREIFGPKVNAKEWTVRAPPPDKRAWNEFDRLLIGEFVRRHHARMAHEFAIYGFPGLPTSIEAAIGFPKLSRILPKFADIIGLVARSHGLQLRTSVDYLRATHEGNLRPRGTVPIYLMALLRVGDYLQLESERAPPVLLNLKAPQSPLSIDEWNKHAAVEHISFAHRDPKAISVEINSTHSLRTHLLLRDLLESVQLELDVSTSVLREVYGRATLEGLHVLSLEKTRVHSNLADPSHLDALPYAPIRSGFEADPHLLTLLVEPLYGQHPEVGIRELIQNSTDAVRERDCFNSNRGLELADTEQSKPDIEITFCEDPHGAWVLSVVDSGVGMEATTIRDYFLRAGASFRSSADWIEEFTDEEGRSRVLRAGRFGIGVFATFLLGNRVTLKTRHISETSGFGFVFDATKDSELIELRREELPVGTTVEIELSRGVAEELGLIPTESPNEDESEEDDRNRLSEIRWRDSTDNEVDWDLYSNSSWDWFTLDYPKICYRALYQSGIEKEMLQAISAPDPTMGSPDIHWRNVKVDDFQGVAFTYNRYPVLTCNGIRVLDETRALDWSSETQFKFPRISVFDRDGKLPLTLTRDRLTRDSLPFEDDLQMAVIRDFIAYCIVRAPTRPPWALSHWDRSYDPSYPLIQRDRDTPFGFERLSWFCTSKGVAPYDEWLCSRNIGPRFLFFGSTGLPHPHKEGTSIEYWYPKGVIQSEGLVACSLAARTDADFGDMPFWASKILKFAKGDWRQLQQTSDRALWGAPTCVKLAMACRDDGRLLKSFRFERPSHKRSRNGWDLYEFRTGSESKCETNVLDLLEAGLHERLARKLTFVCEIQLGDVLSMDPKSLFAKEWNSILEDRVVPFESTARRELINTLMNDDSIGEYVRSWSRSGTP